MLLPTDTVYGLAASADDETRAEGLYALKGREHRQPAALVAASVERLLDLVPELGPQGDRARAAARPVHARAPEPGAPLPAG